MARQILCDRCGVVIGALGQCEKKVYQVWFSPHMVTTSIELGKAAAADVCESCYDATYAFVRPPNNKEKKKESTCEPNF